ncbi:MAG: hypothetical protein NWF07_03540 [Candidatus Bathyarchaeota archaeon]|nr:hypothetical protein [Candidatus Bathyarchaeota archaeon]
MKKILSFIQDKTSWPVIMGVLACSVLLMFMMNGTNLPFSSPTIEKFSGGIPILDMRLSFTPDDAYELFTALGKEGRQAYRLLHLVPDILFPISYSLAFAFIGAWFLVRLLPLDHNLHWLSLIPLVSGTADILENISLVFASLAYPSRIDWLVNGAFLMNRVKFGLLPLGLIFLIVIVVIWFIRKRPGPVGETRTLGALG